MPAFAPLSRLKSLLVASACVLSLGTPGQALELDQMTVQQQSQFGQAVRAYLLENPEVLMEAIAVLEQRKSAAQAMSDEDLVKANALALFDDCYSWVGGNVNGDVTIVEFMDYRCGYCKKAHADVTELVESDGNIRLIYKEFPVLGPESVLAARFAMAVKSLAGDAAYKEVHDALITLRGQMSQATFDSLAKDLSLDLAAVQSEMNSDAVTAALAQNQTLASTLQIQGTPGFVLGSGILRGYVPLDAMREIVAEVRGK